MQPNDTELSLLRTQPHFCELSLSIYNPKIVFECQINITGSSQNGLREIPYDTVLSGTYSNVQSGFTAYIGSTPEGNDVGRIRIKSATNTTLTVAENSFLWEDNQHVTVKDYREIWAIFPRMVQEDDTFIIYKDYDTAYVDQNYNLGAFPVMGTHYAGLVGEQVYYSASGTYFLDSVSGSYNWNFEGGNPTGSNLQTPGYVQYTTPGHYTTSMTVTGDNGVEETSYRHVSIYQEKNLIKNWSMTGFQGSRDNGSYTARIAIRENTEGIVNGALVVIFAKDFYGSTGQSIGGNAVNRSKIVFIGYIIDGSISYNYRDNVTSFEIGSVTELMKNKEGFSVALDSATGVPDQWYEMYNMTSLKAIYHYLRWHSTVLATTDVRCNCDNLGLEYFDANLSSLYDGLNTFTLNSLFARTIADRQGNIYIDKEPFSVSGTSNISLGMSLSKQDWMGGIDLEEKQIETVSMVELGGFSYNFVSSTPYLSKAPGESPLYGGSQQQLRGLVLSSQEQLNVLSGNYLAYKNAKYPSLNMKLVGNYRNVDIAPLERYLITTEPNDTNRGVILTSGTFHVNQISWEYSSDKKVLIPLVTFHQLVNGYPGITEEIPLIPDSEFPPIPSIPIPNFDINFPDWEFPIIPFPVIEPEIPDIRGCDIGEACRGSPDWAGSRFSFTFESLPDEFSGLDCANDINAGANGLFSLPLSGQLVSTECASFYVSAPMFLRSSASANKTYFYIKGLFEYWNGTAYLPLTTTIVPTWINVYGVDQAGNRVTQATLNAYVNGTLGGYFSPSAGTYIRGIEIEISDKDILIPEEFDLSMPVLVGTIICTGTNISIERWQDTGYHILWEGAEVQNNGICNNVQVVQFIRCSGTNYAGDYFVIDGHIEYETTPGGYELPKIEFAKGCDTSFRTVWQTELAKESDFSGTKRLDLGGADVSSCLQTDTYAQSPAYVWITNKTNLEIYIKPYPRLKISFSNILIGNVCKPGQTFYEFTE